MPSDQAVDDPNLVDEKEPKSEAQEARGDSQVKLDPRRAPRYIGEHRPDGGSDQHHPGNSADPEKHEVGDGPPGILDQSKNEQCYCRRAGQAMDEPDEQRAEDLVEPETTEPPVCPRYMPVFVMPVLLRFETRWVAVDIVAMPA
jgi:hypothetical protein